MKSTWEILLDDFAAVEWSACTDSITTVSGAHVYALVVEAEGQSFPLYVGQTQRLLGRIEDYQAAQFHAPTDFRVGEAIRYLCEKQCVVRFLYKPTNAHLKDEKVLIRELLLRGCALLNFLGAFDYKTASPIDERLLVRRFCDMALARSKCLP